MFIIKKDLHLVTINNLPRLFFLNCALSIENVNSIYKKLNNKLENVNGFSFTFFYIPKPFKINKLINVCWFKNTVKVKVIRVVIKKKN